MGEQMFLREIHGNGLATYDDFNRSAFHLDDQDMTALPSIDHLTIAEKLALMELLWTDLSRNAEDVLSPPWHGEVLEEREKSLAEGKTHFEDWEVVKQRLRERKP